MRALIAMSGGVDSSVAAALTLDMGFDCIGCMMKLYEGSDIDNTRTCCSFEDSLDAKSVAFRLGIPFYVFNFCEDFSRDVIGRFVSEYILGRTPNPCIDCNSYMKFDRLYRRARELDCDKIVTGHYARIENRDGRFILKKAIDKNKDQSYVLYRLTQQQLSNTLFPLGGLSKQETRKIALERGFLNAEKRDSQDICFVPDGKYAEFVEGFLGKKSEPGNFVDTTGRVIGRHMGIIRYTIGQHKGLGYSYPDRMYVIKINPEKNEVVLGREEDLYSKELIAGRFNWISIEMPMGQIRCMAKVRYRAQEQPALAEAMPDGSVRIIFDEPVRAITPGQSAVLYDGEEVLGGGIIL